MSKEEEFNPIKHDVKDGELRCVLFVFLWEECADYLRKITYHPFTFNYGYLPQTWENPNENDEFTNLKGISFS